MVRESPARSLCHASQAAIARTVLNERPAKFPLLTNGAGVRFLHRRQPLSIPLLRKQRGPKSDDTPFVKCQRSLVAKRGKCLLAAVSIALALGAQVATCDAQALSARIANYRIEAAYDAQARTITAHEVLSWRNTTTTAATALYFHLYLNAFANSRSSFMRERGTAWVDWLERHPHGWGYIVINAVRMGNADLTTRTEFVHPDDDNIDDLTVMRLPLETAVAPGEAVNLEIDFVAKLPKLVLRAGFAGPFVMAAQWFPKIGVFEDGAWNCHQYHATSEFFADFGVYDVTLTVPRDAVVGASGILQEERTGADGTKTLRFRADDVHDFAWTLDPRFQVIETVAGQTRIRLLLQPGHADQARRYLQAATVAIQRHAEWFGPYPYPQLTIVDPPLGAFAAAGMEYPTLITVGTLRWMPVGLRLPEMVAVHEFGHQYWYGMVANNEFEEPWLDEGVNSYIEGLIMDSTYGLGSYSDLFGLHVNSTAAQRLDYLTATQRDPIVRHAWEFLDHRSYNAIAYAKTALALKTLANYIGDHRLRDALADYFRNWSFRHPHGTDFLAALSGNSGQDLNWYFKQVIEGTGVLDYAIASVDADKVQPLAGYTFSGRQVGEERAPKPDEEVRYHSTVVVERRGSVRMPVELRITFEDGTNTTEHWDGQGRWKRFEYTGPQRVDWAIVDPDEKLALDINRLNNSRMRSAGTRALVRLAGRWGFWFQNLVYFLTGL